MFSNLQNLVFQSAIYQFNQLHDATKLYLNMVSYGVLLKCVPKPMPFEFISKGLHLELPMEINRSDAGIKIVASQNNTICERNIFFCQNFTKISCTKGSNTTV